MKKPLITIAKKCTNRNSNKGHQLINILLAGEIFFYIIYYEGMF